ncbi:MAG: DUF885 domain-containing protein [Bacteroidia bacterium]
MKLISLLLLPVIALAQAPADEKLNTIFADYKEYIFRNFPESATYEGDKRYNDRITDHSAEAHFARYDSLRQFKSRVQEVNRNSISEANKINYDLFLRMINEDLEGEKFNGHYTPINQMGGLHINFPQLINVQPLNNEKDYKDYISRLNKFPLQVNNIITNMRSGVKAGITSARLTVEPVITQIANIIDVPLDSSVFMVFPEAEKLNPATEKQIVEELRAAVKNITTAYKRLQLFVENEYLPAARKEVGIWSLPDGEARYKYAVKVYTSLDDMTQQEIFNTGNKEGERIKTEMQKVKNEINFEGTLQEFNSHLRTSPEFFFTSKDSLMNAYRKILSRMDEQMPSLFVHLPKTKYDLKEIEEYRARSAPAAYYYSAPDDGSRPGYFYVNTYDLSSRPKYTMTALALHEAVPGHHTQIAIAKEMENMPWFRREMGVTAFIEGWALYAESLGYEKGMYDDPYQKYGALSFEMWRACRLVVDAGMHHLKWTKQQAVDFMLQHLPHSELDINSEVDRYIAWPGQALAYKTGELKIKELRAKAEKELGNDFDIRAFHTMLLSEGALPLALLEKNVNEWIRKNK